MVGQVRRGGGPDRVDGAADGASRGDRGDEPAARIRNSWGRGRCRAGAALILGRREAEIELAMAHRGAPVVHLTGLRGALADALDHLGHVEARTLAEAYSL